MIIPLRMNIWFYIFLIVLFFTNGLTLLYSQTKNLNGIKFHSKEVPKAERTSLLLNEGEPIELEKSFSISFDIFFWDPHKFGPILRIEDSRQKEYRIVYSQFKDVDTSYIEIIEPVNKNSFSLKLLKRNLIRNNWFNLKFNFNREKNRIEIFHNSNFVGSLNTKIDDNEFRFAFGIKDLNSPQEFDCPAIAVKNILIKANAETKYYWQLNPFQQNPLSDNISGSEIKVFNHVWLYSDHKKWKLITEFKLQSEGIPKGIAYDSVNSRLFLDEGDKLIVYDILTGNQSANNYNTKSPAFWHELFYDHDKQLLYSVFKGKGKVSIFDLRKNEWLVKDTSTNAAGHYFGSAKFISHLDNQIYLLGGYGWYRTKNDLLRYNFINQEWEKVKLKKNEMNPSAWFSLAEGFKKGEYLIFGGFGNETGMQEDGFNISNDLYLLNLNDSTIKKLNLSLKNKFNFQLLHNYGYIDKSDSIFYFLSQNEVGKGMNISLNSLNLKSGEILPLANKFWEANYYKWMDVNLFYNQSTNEFISVVFDNKKVKLYSISYPPISETEKTFIQISTEEDNFILPVIIIATGLVSIIIVFFIIKSRKEKFVIKEKLDFSNTENLNYKKLQTKNSIKLFGGFFIYDKDGNEISTNLSPKLKEIFLLILLKSFNNHRSGITSEELSSIIWPDSSPESVKSNRGVAVNKIRKMLSSVEGIQLEFSDKLWFISLANDAFCDYAEYKKIYNTHKKTGQLDNNLAENLLNILEGGEFLKAISYEWLDALKFAVNNEVIDLLKNFLDKDEIKAHPEKIIKICDTILSFDSVDQDAIKLKVLTLFNQGKINIAKNVFNLFVAEYKRIYDEPFPLTFKDLTSS